MLPISFWRKEKKKKKQLEEFHIPTWQALALSVCFATFSLSSPLFLFLLPQPTPIYFAHILSGLCYYEILLLQGISYPAFLSMVPSRSCHPWDKPYKLSQQRQSGVLSCCSFDYDRLGAATCWNRRTVLLTLLWFWHTSCWLAAKTRSGVETSEKRKTCLSEIVMLKPGGHFRGSLIISKSLCQMLVIRIRTVGWQKRAHNLHFMLLDLIYFVWHTHTHPHTSALSEKWCRSLLLQLFCCCGCVYPQQYYTRPLSLQPRREKASSITCCVVLCWHGL